VSLRSDGRTDAPSGRWPASPDTPHLVVDRIGRAIGVRAGVSAARGRVEGEELAKRLGRERRFDDNGRPAGPPSYCAGDRLRLVVPIPLGVAAPDGAVVGTARARAASLSAGSRGANAVIPTRQRGPTGRSTARVAAGLARAAAGDANLPFVTGRQGRAVRAVRAVAAGLVCAAAGLAA
jgi:hypothetical protein